MRPSGGRKRAEKESFAGPAVVEHVDRQRKQLRGMLDEWEGSLGLSADQRRVIEDQQQNKIHRRVLALDKLGDELQARAILAVNAQFLERIQKHPHDLLESVITALAVQQEIRQYNGRIQSFDAAAEDALAGLKRLTSVTNLFARMRRASERASKAQSQKAARPRPKKGLTGRSITIQAMRASRAEGRSLDQFISAAEQGSVQGLELSFAEGPDRQAASRSYHIDCAAPEGSPVTRRTLYSWWTEAGKAFAD